MNTHPMAAVSIERLEGVLIGTAVGDSIGLPMEGLSARRQAKLFPPPLRQRLVGSRGMVSDDTEHTVMVAQSLLQSPRDPVAFQRALARRLRWWLLSLPAGVGFATLRAILKLWLGFPPTRSGVHSAGNGPAMRSALFGVYFHDEPERRRAYTQASAEITHRDPRGVAAAMAVSEVASWMVHQSEDTEVLLQGLTNLNDGAEWQSIFISLRDSLSANDTAIDFARRIGAKAAVSGYALQSVPVAIYSAIRNRNDFASALAEAIACGGDTDTTGAITGALVGARVGTSGIPVLWQQRIGDFPCSLSFLQRLAAALHRQQEAGQPSGALSIFWPAIPIRNLAFLAVVLTHGIRRIFPPY